jgi:hypothetical protein
MASRILHKTPDQEVWLSQGTWICMNQAEIPWEPLGRYGLKGITGEVELYRAVPRHRAFLPEPVVEAVRTGRLIHLHIGDAIPNLPPRAVLMLTGFTPGTPALKDATDRLPVVDPASVWLNAYNIAPQDRDSPPHDPWRVGHHHPGREQHRADGPGHGRLGPACCAHERGRGQLHL